MQDPQSPNPNPSPPQQPESALPEPPEPAQETSQEPPLETLPHFITRKGIRFERAPVREGKNPNMALEGYAKGRDTTQMDHWRVRLSIGTRGKDLRSFQTYFSMGSGYEGKPPTVQDVLGCLISDVTDEPFEEWAFNFGFDPDSRSAHQTYKAVLKQTARLKTFLGEGFDEAMKTESE